MKTTKDVILREAFRLFMEKNYEKVTVSELEKATGVSRGGIFHYMGNKEGLFRKVVDKYIFEVTNIYDRISYLDINATRFEDLIGIYLAEVDKNFLYLVAESGLILTDCIKSYYKFMLQAEKYYPNFNYLMNKYDANIFYLWKNILDSSKKSGEIRMDVDSVQVIELFRYTYFGVTYGTTFMEDIIDVQKMTKDFNFIYSLIKNDKDVVIFE